MGWATSGAPPEKARAKAIFASFVENRDHRDPGELCGATGTWTAIIAGLHPTDAYAKDDRAITSWLVALRTYHFPYSLLSVSLSLPLLLEWAKDEPAGGRVQR